MPNERDDLPDRVTALENEMAQVRERLSRASDDSEAARVLAAGADRDVSEVRAELRAHRSALNALHQTLSETRRDMQAGFREMRDEFGEMRTGFAMVGAGFAAISERLDRAIGED